MTIKDIARESGYAVSTVSRALNNHPDVSRETKDKINEVVAKHKFVPNNNARQLKAQSSKSIAIVVKGAFNMFFAAIIEQLQSLIQEDGYTASVHYVDEEQDEVQAAKRICLEKKPLGLIFLGGNISTFKQHFCSIELPCVLATTTSKELEFDNLSCVGIDDSKAACEAISYLLHKGHRNIGVLGGRRELSYISALRYEGCCDAYKTAGLVFNEDYYQKANYNYGSAYRATQKLISRKKDITAIFAMSDIMAVGAMRAIHDAKLTVPDDISVIGFDGIELADYLTPSLTTIRQPQSDIAKNSVALLLSHIEKNTPARNIILPSTLIEGESVITCH
ncbi:MAG: LacI family DNA-binding transcriptional regulator [Oscillospiraceae bacterium]